MLGKDYRTKSELLTGFLNGDKFKIAGTSSTIDKDGLESTTEVAVIVRYGGGKTIASLRKVGKGRWQ